LPSAAGTPRLGLAGTPGQPPPPSASLQRQRPFSPPTTRFLQTGSPSPSLPYCLSLLLLRVLAWGFLCPLQTPNIPPCFLFTGPGPLPPCWASHPPPPPPLLFRAHLAVAPLFRSPTVLRGLLPVPVLILLSLLYGTISLRFRLPENPLPPAALAPSLGTASCVAQLMALCRGPPPPPTGWPLPTPPDSFPPAFRSPPAPQSPCGRAWPPPSARAPVPLHAPSPPPRALSPSPGGLLVVFGPRTGRGPGPS